MSYEVGIKRTQKNQEILPLGKKIHVCKLQRIDITNDEKKLRKCSSVNNDHKAT